MQNIYHKKSHSKHLIKLHFVIAVKYRKSILVGIPPTLSAFDVIHRIKQISTFKIYKKRNLLNLYLTITRKKTKPLAIKRKNCKCSPTCKFPPTISFNGYYYAHAPQEIKDRQGDKAKKTYQSKLKRQRDSNLSRKLHQVGNGTKKEISPKFEPRSSFKSGSTIPDKGELLALADKLFSQYIKKRDAVDGVITCVCCGGRYDVTAKDSSGDKIVQCLHFVSRRVYSLRFSPINCHAGCSACNRDMFENENGLAYRQFRAYLVSCVGEMDVREMEKQKREINKLSAGDLQSVINLYKKGKS